MNFNAPTQLTVIISAILVAIGGLTGLGAFNLGINGFYFAIAGYIVLLIGVVARGA